MTQNTPNLPTPTAALNPVPQIPMPSDDLLEQLDQQIADAEQALAVLRTVRKSLADLRESGATSFTPADLNVPGIV